MPSPPPPPTITVPLTPDDHVLVLSPTLLLHAEERLPTYKEVTMTKTEKGSLRKVYLYSLVATLLFTMTFFLLPRLPVIYLTSPVLADWPTPTSVSMMIPLTIKSSNYYPFHIQSIRIRGWPSFEQPQSEVTPSLWTAIGHSLQTQPVSKDALPSPVHTKRVETRPPPEVAMAEVTLHDLTIPAQGALELNTKVAIPLLWTKDSRRLLQVATACTLTGKMAVTYRADVTFSGLLRMAKPIVQETIMVPCRSTDFLGLSHFTPSALQHRYRTGAFPAAPEPTRVYVGSYWREMQRMWYGLQSPTED